MRVIGTAGHVDHGKSTLVRKLTGIDPDRLAEEKAREMTIDLGFAWFNLPNGETLGVIDVPGHRDFIENMLAGVGGIDAVLLVIAADEGVMPQTREHLAILDLLGIENGLIALTKTDMVEDESWLELVEQDIRDITAATALARAPLIRVSAHTGTGIPALLSSLSALLDSMPPRVDYKHPRLPIDRVFTISGFGTVVTGTLLGGALRVGDEVEVQPGGLRGRVRGLQSYKQPVERAEPGSRTAVNISGLDRKSLARGQVLSHPGLMQAGEWVDVRFRHLPDVGRPLKHDAQVKFFVGAAESLAQVRLLNDEMLAPGQESWLQLRLEHAVALAQGDRFILRYPSPSQTIGGGVVVNPHPERRWRRFQADVIADLETRMRGTPAQRVAQAASQREPLKRAGLQKQLGYSDADLSSAIHDALEQGLLVELGDSVYMAAETVSSLLRQMTGELRLFHEVEPLRLGMSREELRTRVGLKSATFGLLLAVQDQIVEEQNRVRLNGHQVVFTAEQQARIAELEARFAAAPYTPPSFAEAAQIVGESLLYALIDLGNIVQVQPDVIFAAPVYQELVDAILQSIDQDGQIAVNTLRDRFGTTRKYAIGLLEYLDSIHVTRRVGDARVRGPRSG
jgi:selenocysteine-specific elongation factor